MCKVDKTLAVVGKQIRSTATIEELIAIIITRVGAMHASCVEHAFREHDGEITHQELRKLAVWDNYVASETASQIREMFQSATIRTKTDFRRRRHPSVRNK